MDEQDPSLEGRMDRLERDLEALRAQLAKTEATIEEIPKPPDMRHEMPIYAFEHDQYFRSQLDRGQLTLMLNTDALRRDMISPPGGGGGLMFVGYCRITAIAPTGVVDARGNDVQWEYQVEQIKKGAAGYGDAKWVLVDGGYVGTARNMCENGNTGVGVQNNGVDFDAADFPEGFMMITLQDTAPLPLYLMNDENGNVEAWIDRCNAVDGLCSDSGSG